MELPWSRGGVLRARPCAARRSSIRAFGGAVRRARWYDFVIPGRRRPISTAVKKTISLPADLAREAEALARAEGKTLSGVIQEALRQARIGRRQQELRGVQGYWSRKARERGLVTEADLERYLRA